MSMPAPYFRCDCCSYSAGILPIETWHYLLPDGRTAVAPVQLCWCRTCEGLQRAEDLPSPFAIQYSVWETESLVRQARYSKNECRGPENSTIARLVEQLQEGNDRAVVLREVIRARSSANRCLRCGSSHIVSSVLVPDRENTSPTASPEIAIKHPGCGGYITQRDEEDPDGIRADWIATEVYLDVEGCRLD